MPATRLRSLLLTGTTCALLGLAPGIGHAASAAAPAPAAPTVTVLSSMLSAPYQLAEERHRVYVGDGGTSIVSRLTRSGLAPVVDGPHPGEVTGVALNDQGDLAYANTDFATGSARLTVKPRRGGTMNVDLGAFESARNPDGAVHYGIDDPTPCDDVLDNYFGRVDSHPYAVAALHHSAGWVVADAGGNDLLKVDARGRISVLAVLPRQGVLITSQVIDRFNLPGCLLGKVYFNEAVPTDVEIDADDHLTVSLLPGGPEDAGMGARGSVWQYDLSGRGRMLAGGFLGATNVALGSHHRIFVAELFAGRISVIDRRGTVSPYVTLPRVVSLVWLDDVLYAGTLADSPELMAPRRAAGTAPTGADTPGTLVAIR